MYNSPGKATVILVFSQAFFNGSLAVEVMCLGRWLEPEALGLYFYGLSLGSLFEVCVHWGAQHYLNREVAARFDQARCTLPAFLSFSILALGLITLSLALGAGWPVALIAGALMGRAGAAMIGAMFIGRQDILPPVLGRLVSQSLLLLSLWFVVRAQPSLQIISLVLAGIASIYLMAQIFSLPRIQFSVLEHNDPRGWPGRWQKLLQRLFPFVLLFFFGQFHYRADAVLIKWLAGIEAVSAVMLAFKWIEGFFFVAAVVSTAAIPVLMQARGEGPRLRRLLRLYAVGLAAGLSLLAALLAWVGIPVLEYIIGHRFAASLPYYRLLIWAVPLQGLGFFFSTALIAFQQEKNLLRLTGATMGLGLAAKTAALTAGNLRGFALAVLAALALHALVTGTALYRRAWIGSPIPK